MISTTESTAATQEAMGSFAKMLADLAQKGVETFGEAQKTMLDMAAQQTATAVKTAKQGLSVAGAAPIVAMLDLAQKGITQMIQVQKGVLDLSSRQSAIVTDAMREQAEIIKSAAMTETVREIGERMIAAQRIVLDYAAKQHELTAEAVRPGSLASGQGLADSVRQGVDVFVETQKQLLEVASKPLKAQTAAA